MMKTLQNKSEQSREVAPEKFNEAGLHEILQEGKRKFFPDGISPKGSESDFMFQLWDFKLRILVSPLAV